MRSAERFIMHFLLPLLFLIMYLPAAAADRKPIEIKKNDKCRVCGMFVSAYPEWVAEIVFKDGTYATFDGPKDMFRYFLNIAKFDPCQLPPGVTAGTLKLNGSERFDVVGLNESAQPGQALTLVIHRSNGADQVPLILRLDTAAEIDYVRHGGIMPYVLSEITRGAARIVSRDH